MYVVKFIKRFKNINRIVMLIFVAILSGCSTDSYKTNTIYKYCSYVRLPKINRPIIKDLNISVYINKYGMVENLTVNDIIAIKNDRDILIKYTDSQLQEIMFYRKVLTEHNENCTKPTK